MPRKSAKSPKVDDKTAKIEAVEAMIKKHLGYSSVTLADGLAINIDRISSGSLGLDEQLKGGLPRGRLVELFGNPSSGKTTLCLKAMAECQKNGELVAYVDAEHSSDPEWMSIHGVDLAPERFRFFKPQTGEDALRIVDMLVESGLFGLIVVDSVAALVPRNEFEGDVGDAHVGGLARLVGQFCRIATTKLDNKPTTLILVNQMRMKIGNVGHGSPYTTPGGKGLEHHSSVRIELKHIARLKDAKGEAIGIRVKATVVKNKVGPPMRSTEYEIYNSVGMCQEMELITLGISKKVLSSNGAWLSYGENRLGCGKGQAMEFLIENPDIAEQIKAEIFDKGAASEHGDDPTATEDETLE